MRFKIVCILISLLLTISFSAVANTISTEEFNTRNEVIDQNENYKFIEWQYTIMIGLISNYLEDGDDVTFHANFLFLNFFSSWQESYADILTDNEIYFNTSGYIHSFFKTRPGPNGLSFYIGRFGDEVDVSD